MDTTKRKRERDGAKQELENFFYFQKDLLSPYVRLKERCPFHDFIFANVCCDAFENAFT